jgi:DNA-binding response OmpR family regulator
MPAKRILLVEGEPEIHQLLSRALRDGGYAVDVAATAAEASRCLDDHSYALAIVDWRLPDATASILPIARLSSEPRP